MSAPDFDALCPRQGSDGKTYYTKIGSAWSTKNGGYSILLNALPIPDGEGRVCILLFEPLDKSEQGGGGYGRGGGQGGGQRQGGGRQQRQTQGRQQRGGGSGWEAPPDLDDEIPF